MNKVYTRFDNPQSFVSACQAINVSFRGSEWFGNIGSERAFKLAKEGDESRVKKAQSIVDKFSNEVDLGLVYPTWESDVCGSYPNVPNFLAGIPETMMRRTLQVSERAPVTIWVCVTSSGGIPAKLVEDRGIAIMALAMALSQTRAVSVRLFSGLGGPQANHIVSIDLPQPFSLSQAAFCLSSQSFSRGLTYEYLELSGGANGGWPRDVSHGDYKRRSDEWKKLLPIESQDILFPHMFMNDKDLSDPVGFCNAIFKDIVSPD